MARVLAGEVAPADRIAMRAEPAAWTQLIVVRRDRFEPEVSTSYVVTDTMGNPYVFELTHVDDVATAVEGMRRLGAVGARPLAGVGDEGLEVTGVDDGRARIAGRSGTTLLAGEAASEQSAALHEMIATQLAHVDRAVSAPALVYDLLPDRSREYAGLTTVAHQATSLARSGRYVDAVTLLEACVRFEPDNATALNALAWILATAPDAGVRDGQQAVAYARQANELAQEQQAAYMDTLAAAYAESGQFNEAVRWEEKALAGKDVGAADANRYRARLDMYRDGQPYRDGPVPTAEGQ
jgi:hypothetical protein